MSTDLDAPEHALCSDAIGARDREIRWQTNRGDMLKARAEKAEAAVARLRSAGRRLLDALDDHSCQDMGRSKELMLADATLEDALVSTSGPTDKA